MAAQVLSGSVVEGSVDPFSYTIDPSTDLPDLTGATPGFEVYLPTGKIVLPASGWTFTESTSPAASGDPMVLVISPPPAGYPIGGFKFDGTNVDGSQKFGFRCRAFLTLSGESFPRPCGAAEITVTARNKRP